MVRWFSGSVEEAIGEKTTKNALLMVHVTDNGTDSQAMDSLWESVEIKDVPLVALRLIAGTPQFQQFAQFYPVMVMPCAYFIGQDGKVIEIVVGKKSSEELAVFWQRAVNTFKSVTAPSTPAPAPQQNATRVSPAREISQPPQQIDESSNASERSSSTTENQPARPSGPTIEERLQRTREVVAQRERDREREDELRRRNAGQEMAKIREDIEAKQRDAEKEKQRREKEADKVYLEKLRKQLEQDRLDKAAKFNSEKAKEKEERDAKERKRAEEAAEKAAREQAARASIARIQFRLPNGASVVKNFEPADQLSKCLEFAKTLIPKAGKNVSLSTVSPRHIFTAEDLEKTLVELTLAPSAVLLVLNGDGASSSPRSSGEATNIFSMFVASFFNFLATVWAFFSGFIFGQPAVAAPTATPVRPNRQISSASSSGNESPPSGSANKKQTSSGEPRPGVGKVYRLHDLKRDDDADKATWNGNSTNQM